MGGVALAHSTYSALHYGILFWLAFDVIWFTLINDINSTLRGLWSFFRRVCGIRMYNLFCAKEEKIMLSLKTHKIQDGQDVYVEIQHDRHFCKSTDYRSIDV